MQPYESTICGQFIQRKQFTGKQFIAYLRIFHGVIECLVYFVNCEKKNTDFFKFQIIN